MNDSYFKKINYSASNEDSQSELKALNLTHEDTVLCISGSGARPLDLLTASPKKVISIDFNPAQNHLLALKIAGYKGLNYEEFAELIGLQSSQNRLDHFEAILPFLPVNSKRFWKQNTSLIKDGVLYCGTWEKLLRGISKATFLRKHKIKKLLDSKDLKSQQAYWKKHWSGQVLKTFLKVISNRFLWTTIIREPGAKLIARDFDVAEYMYDCLEKMANHSLIRENPYGNLLFFGQYTKDCVLPLHLQKKQFSSLKEQVQNIEIITAPLQEYLNSHKNTIDAFSLSDFSSYAPKDVYKSIWESVLSAAKDGARFCERFFLVQNTPEKLFPEIVRNSLLEQEMEQNDHTCIYTFSIGKIQKIAS